MRASSALILLAAVAQQALAGFTYNVTATHKGQPIAAAAIKLDAFEPTLNPLNRTALPPVKPPTKPGSAARKQRRSIGTAYSSNWCGAVLHSTGPLITEAHAIFTAPELTARAGVSSYPQYVGEWVGIDGLTHPVILQAGVAHSISSSNVQTNWAWFQWYPSAAYTITSFPIDADDWVEVYITASSSTSGSITINNLSQDYSYTISLSGGTALARVDAEWIVEDPAGGSGLEPFAAFTDIWFEEVYANTNISTTLGVDASTMYSINSNTCVAVEYDDGDFYAYSD